MKYLRPLIMRDAWYKPIEATINEAFERMLFAPLREALRSAGVEILNARSQQVERAIESGLLYWEDGKLHGAFNAKLSRELKALGAVFDGRTKTWSFPNALPAPLQMAVARAHDKADTAINAVIRTLDGLKLEDTRTEKQLREQYGTGVWRINADFVAAAAQISIVPEITAAAAQAIATDYAKNLDLYIKGWVKEAIFDLREKIQDNTMRGQRSANMIKTIQQTHGVSKEKAKFLARQETSLLVSKMREQRYRDIGVTRYKWVGMDDERERPDHKVLNNTIHSFDDPPITDRRTGARNNPGEDYNCRCLAVPILED